MNRLPLVAITLITASLSLSARESVRNTKRKIEGTWYSETRAKSLTFEDGTILLKNFGNTSDSISYEITEFDSLKDIDTGEKSKIRITKDSLILGDEKGYSQITLMSEDALLRKEAKYKSYGELLLGNWTIIDDDEFETITFSANDTATVYNGEESEKMGYLLSGNLLSIADDSDKEILIQNDTLSIDDGEYKLYRTDPKK